jgi:2-keto-3-deoxy-6-phosphogluconate aldolase
MTTGRATRAAAVGERILADGVIAIFRGVPPDGVLGLAADLAGGVRVLEVPLTEPAGAGAEFVVSAGFFDAVAEACLAEDLLYPPGMLSASEVGRALVDGFDLLKLFPAGPVGPRWLAALLGPSPDAKFIAVGNLDEQGLLDALDAGAVGVSLGSAVLGLPRPELARLVDRLRARHGAKLSSSS